MEKEMYAQETGSPRAPFPRLSPPAETTGRQSSSPPTKRAADQHLHRPKSRSARKKRIATYLGVEPVEEGDHICDDGSRGG